MVKSRPDIETREWTQYVIPAVKFILFSIEILGKT